MNEFSLITDHSLLLQSRGSFDGGTDAIASMFAVDGYAGVADFSSESSTVSAEDEQRKKGKDSFFCDLPELGGFDDLETSMSLNTTFEIGSNYFDDTLWSSVYSPDAGLVPISCFDSTTNVSSVQNQSAISTLVEPSVSVPDQINMSHSTNIKQEARSDGRNHTPSSNEAHASSSSREIDQFSLLIDAELFGPFMDGNIGSAKQTGGWEGLEAITHSNRDMQQAPAASGTMIPDESVVSSSTCSGPDLAAAQIPCSKRKLNDPLHNGTPDMLLQGLAENPLGMYFPPLTSSEQPEVLMSDTSTQSYQEFAGSSSAPSCAGMQFCPSSAELHEQPPSTLILEAVPVKDLVFQKLQNGMNQMDVATKGRIRDALYRLANSVEQRHYAASTRGSGLAVGSSSSKRFRSGRWAEMQTNPMDQSVAQLLLQKPPYRNSVTSSRMTY